MAKKKTPAARPAFALPYQPDPKFATSVAYFSMEFAIDQPLKIYSGGLGYLAGSHLRSAVQLRQNVVGIGILWSYGYYDQDRQPDQHLRVSFLQKQYAFLQPTNLRFQITIHRTPVTATAYYLPPEVFGSAPLFLLTTDLPENDQVSRNLSHRLYDDNLPAKIAQSILLGQGGVRLLDLLGLTPQIYHLNESHALPVAFALYEKFGNAGAVRERLVFTNHTPEEAGNQKTDIRLLDKMSFFGDIPLDEARRLTQTDGDVLDHTLAALRLAKRANGVSKMHTETLRRMYGDWPGIAPLEAITNAQNEPYWADAELYQHLNAGNDAALTQRKHALKKPLFDVVADQTGKLFRPDVLTIVWARRFAAYKRAELLVRDRARFERLVSNPDFPVQIIWAGKPYPADYGAIGTFDYLVDVCKPYPNCAVLTGYELWLSKKLKQGADVWLNTPRITREASGTSGMTAAMNGAVNVSIPDGWVPEFLEDGVNGFSIPANAELSIQEQDEQDAEHLYRLLEEVVIPMYYQQPDRWLGVVKRSMTDVLPRFDSARMATEYYEKLYWLGGDQPAA
jgi:starch phosphorylase